MRPPRPSRTPICGSGPAGGDAAIQRPGDQAQGNGDQPAASPAPDDPVQQEKFVRKADGSFSLEDFGRFPKADDDRPGSMAAGLPQIHAKDGPALAAFAQRADPYSA